MIEILLTLFGVEDLEERTLVVGYHSQRVGAFGSYLGSVFYWNRDGAAKSCVDVRDQMMVVCDDAGLMGPECRLIWWVYGVLLWSRRDCLPSVHAEHVNERACLSLQLLG